MRALPSESCTGSESADCPVLIRICQFVVNERLSAPVRFGGLMAGFVKGAPGPSLVGAIGLRPFLRSVEAIEDFVADFLAEMEACCPLRCAVLEVKSLWAFEKDATVAGSRGPPFGFQFSG